AEGLSPMTFTPSEQVRYEENERFGALISQELLWLVRQTTTINLDELDTRCAAAQECMTPQQQVVFEAVVRRIKHGIHFCQSFPKDRLPELVTTLKEARYITKRADVTTEVRPLSIVVSITANNGYGVTDHGGSIPLNDVFERVNADPLIKEAMKYCIITHDENIRNVGRAQGKEAVIAHELFHNLYKLMIAPEQHARYTDPQKKQLFIEGKDEILAYLTQGIWEFHPGSLFLSLRRKEPKGQPLPEDVHLENLWTMVANSDVDHELSPEERERGADLFLDEVWNVMRAIGFLRFSEASREDGIQAIIATQSFKEMVFALLAIQDTIPRVPAKTVWDSFQEKARPSFFAHELHAFLEEYSWLRLPQLDQPQVLLQSLRDYINDLSAQSTHDGAKDVSRLEGIYGDLAEYFG
ncbi:hypothetical protein KBD13_02030, partial [Patescibacteria group bacterium]|nr:hypothetical protein [Patescibacteria group bacterium]